jgi:uncharacterized protein
MPDHALMVVAILFFLVGALYASVGHAGASGYLAVMALVSFDVFVMRPTALAINVLVAAIAFTQFARAGHFSFRLFWPFALASVPAAFIGGSLEIPARPLKVAIGVVLLLTAVRMAWMATGRFKSGPPSPPRLPVALASGGAIGLVAGLTGTGGGIFLSPLMLLFNWAGTQQVAATAALFILLNSIAGLAGMVATGWRPDPSLPWLAIAACAGGLLGASYGSRWATPRILRLLLAAVLILAGAKLIGS